MKHLLLFILTATFLLSLGSCKKDKTDIPAQPGHPVMAVIFPEAYFTIDEVDSAFATWIINDVEQRIQLTVTHDSLLADINAFTEGSGKLQYTIYGNKKFANQFKASWIFSKPLTLDKTKSLISKGPSSFHDPDWLPRASIKDGIGHSATVALRPEDPFFEVADPGHNVMKLVVDRGYWKNSGAVYAGGGVWECTTGCQSVKDNDYFKFIPSRIGQRPWDHISIIIVFETTKLGEGWALQLEHNL